MAPVLRTRRLLLNALSATDFEAYAAMWAEPDVIRYTSRKPQTRQDAWLRIMRSAGFWSVLGYGGWAARDAVTGHFLGDVGFGDFHRGCTPSHDGVPEMGWAFAPACHGQGFATEAVAACLRWADEVAAFPMVVCAVDPENGASLRVAEKNGFVQDGKRHFGEDEVLFFRRARGG